MFPTPAAPNESARRRLHRGLNAFLAAQVLGLAFLVSWNHLWFVLVPLLLPTLLGALIVGGLRWRAAQGAQPRRRLATALLPLALVALVPALAEVLFHLRSFQGERLLREVLASHPNRLSLVDLGISGIRSAPENLAWTPEAREVRLDGRLIGLHQAGKGSAVRWLFLHLGYGANRSGLGWVLIHDPLPRWEGWVLHPEKRPLAERWAMEGHRLDRIRSLGGDIYRVSYEQD